MNRRFNCVYCTYTFQLFVTRIGIETNLLILPYISKYADFEQNQRLDIGNYKKTSL